MLKEKCGHLGVVVTQQAVQGGQPIFQADEFLVGVESGNEEGEEAREHVDQHVKTDRRALVLEEQEWGEQLGAALKGTTIPR